MAYDADLWAKIRYDMEINKLNLKDVSEKYNINASTISYRKKADNWSVGNHEKALNKRKLEILALAHNAKVDLDNHEEIKKAAAKAEAYNYEKIDKIAEDAATKVINEVNGKCSLYFIAMPHAEACLIEGFGAISKGVKLLIEAVDAGKITPSEYVSGLAKLKITPDTFASMAGMKEMAQHIQNIQINNNIDQDSKIKTYIMLPKKQDAPTSAAVRDEISAIGNIDYSDDEMND